MADIIFRISKGSELTYQEMDDNFDILDKHYYLSDTDPTTTDDDSKNFKLGCLWTNILTNNRFKCTDTTTNNAIWGNANLFSTKKLDETNLADDKIIQYDNTSGKFILVDIPLQFSTKKLDETNLADGKIIQYDNTSGKFILVDNTDIAPLQAQVNTNTSDVGTLNSFETTLSVSISAGWVAKSANTARDAFPAIYYNDGVKDKMFISGGTNGSDMIDTWEYDIAGDSWTQKTNLPAGRSAHSAIYYNDGTNNLMIIFGGYSGGLKNDVWEYNLDTDLLTQKTSGASTREYHSAIYYNNGTNNLMVIFGGYSGSNLNDVWEYNLDTDIWTQKTSGASGRYNHSAIYYNNGTNNLMVIFGGYSGSYLNDVWEYNLDTNVWTQKTSGASGRYRHIAIQYMDNNNPYMLVYGGSNGSALGDIWKYDLIQDVWTQQIGNDGASRFLGAGINYVSGNSQIMLVHAGASSDYLADTEEYTIATTVTNDGISSDSVINKSNKQGDYLTEVLNNLPSASGLVGTKSVDETNLADLKILQYSSSLDKYQLIDLPTGGSGGDFVSITETNTGYGTSYRASNPNYYGDIGDSAIDLSFSEDASTTLGATGWVGNAFNYETTAQGYASSAFGGYTIAEGWTSMAIGESTKAKADSSLSTGYQTYADIKGEISFGYNSYPNGRANASLLSFGLRTTDGTASWLYVLQNSGNSGFEYFTYTLVATKDDFTEKWVSTGEFIAFRDAGNTSCTISNLASVDKVKDISAWSISFDPSSDGFAIAVTGESGKNILWSIKLERVLAQDIGTL